MPTDVAVDHGVDDIVEPLGQREAVHFGIARDELVAPFLWPGLWELQVRPVQIDDGGIELAGERDVGPISDGCVGKLLQLGIQTHGHHPYRCGC